MIIFSFDCAIENMGFCYVEFDENWRSSVEKTCDTYRKLYSDILDQKKVTDKSVVVQRILDSLRHTDVMLDNILQIKHVNVFNLSRGVPIDKMKIHELTTSMKFFLCYIDAFFPRPDVVLIEYQMVQNNISRTICNQIYYHYMPAINAQMTYKGDTNDQKHNMLTYAAKNNEFALHDSERADAWVEFLGLQDKIRIETVGPTLKNKYSLSKEGEYANFITKYSNYTANKKHTAYNFKHFLSVFKREDILLDVGKKLDDMADAFMTIFAWLKDNEFL